MLKAMKATTKKAAAPDALKDIQDAET